MTTCKEAIDNYVELLNDLAEIRKCEGITFDESESEGIGNE